MADENFGQDFMWYEWGFVAPEDFPRDDLDVATDSGEFGRTVGSTVPPSYVQERSDVWREHP